MKKIFDFVKTVKNNQLEQKLIGNQTKVQQVMEYTVKFCILSVLMDKMMIGKQFNSGINKFLNGLKTYAEK